MTGEDSAGGKRALQAAKRRSRIVKHVPLRPSTVPGVLPQAELLVTRRSTFPALIRRCSRLFLGSTKRSSSLLTLSMHTYACLQ